MKMAATSISGLRGYSSIPVKVIFLDNSNDSPDDFFRFCDKLDVELIQKEWFESEFEPNYFPINKAHMRDITDDEVLFIDTDTFIFSNVEEIFEKYSEFDMVACENKWVDAGWNDSYLKIKPMNSGVMYWKGDWMRAAANAMPEICITLKNKEYPLSDYLYQIDEGCWNREEFAYSIFVGENGLNHSYFDREDVHNLLWESEIEDARKSTVLHSYAAQWRKVYNAVYGPPKKRISKKLLMHKRRTQHLSKRHFQS